MKYRVTLNNRVYEVEVEQGEAMLLNEYELSAPAAPAAAPTAPAAAAAAAAPAAPAVAPEGGEAVKSPMPGNVLKICVTQGQKVSEGDVLLILEAMKMENEVVSTRSGTVVRIAVNTGAVVETGTPLVIIA